MYRGISKYTLVGINQSGIERKLGKWEWSHDRDLFVMCIISSFMGSFVYSLVQGIYTYTPYTRLNSYYFYCVYFLLSRLH